MQAEAERFHAGVSLLLDHHHALSQDAGSRGSILLVSHDFGSGAIIVKRALVLTGFITNELCGVVSSVRSLIEAFEPKDQS